MNEYVCLYLTKNLDTIHQSNGEISTLSLNRTLIRFHLIIYIEVSKPFKILIIVIESKFLYRLSEQQSKRRDGLMNKTKNTSEHHLYLYIILNREKKNYSFFFLICSMMATTVARIFTPNWENEEKWVYDLKGGAQSSLTVMGGHRWSYSIEIKRKERDKVQ